MTNKFYDLFRSNTEKYNFIKEFCKKNDYYIFLLFDTDMVLLVRNHSLPTAQSYSLGITGWDITETMISDESTHQVQERLSRMTMKENADTFSFNHNVNYMIRSFK